MRLDPASFPEAGPRPIDGYGPGFFRVGGQVHQGALALLPDGSRAVWAGYAEWAVFLLPTGAPDVVFIGTGAEIAPLPPPFRAALEGAGVGVEIMNTPSACRTYNVCLAEGRRIAAGLLPV